MKAGITKAGTNRHEEVVFNVYNFLVTAAVGKSKAISARDLSGLFCLPQRRLRDVVNEIRTSDDFEKVIGSCPLGYFVCANEEEVWRTNNSLRHHALSELQVYYANERKAGRNGQGKLPVDNDGDGSFIESLARAE